MGVVLGQNNYGKSAVRLVKVSRGGERHELKDLTVDIAFEGRYESVHQAGDNAPVLPTDTMKNTVYALARLHPVERIEAFAETLVDHFLAATEQVSKVRVRIAAHDWQRLAVDGAAHHHAFVRGSAERRVAVVTGDRNGLRVEGGIEELQVLKTTGSAFEGYLKDRFTTLRETSDRIFATSVTARWRVAQAVTDYDSVFARARGALLDTFAGHDSKSVQHTLYAMAEAALDACPEIDEIHLSMPNKHHILVDLSPFDLDNPNEVFVATPEPYGLIEATVRRAD
ncbi:MAG TPA: urate oxidase [Longimicrobium sp.]|nr:urate oxidase [Longimicrobium sp.]